MCSTINVASQNTSLKEQQNDSSGKIHVEIASPVVTTTACDRIEEENDDLAGKFVNCDNNNCTKSSLFQIDQSSPASCRSDVIVRCHTSPQRSSLLLNRRSASWSNLDESTSSNFLQKRENANLVSLGAGNDHRNPSELSLPAGGSNFLIADQNSRSANRFKNLMIENDTENPRRGSLGIGNAGCCEMCSNYEIRLQQMQDNDRHLRQQLIATQHCSDQLKAELAFERSARVEIEQRWTSAHDAVEAEMADLRCAVDNVEASVEREKLVHKEAKLHRHDELLTIKEENRRVQELYNNLLGRHKARASSMTREPIDLPQTVEELQLMCLQLREELIDTKLARDHLEDSLKADILFLKEQIVVEQQSKEQIEASLSDEINNLRTALGIAKSRLSEGDHWKKSCAEKDRLIEQQRVNIGDLENALAKQTTENKQLEMSVLDNRQRSHILQRELDNCEQVQRDFVRLSQSLQMELEKIRQGDQEVRWQFEEDAVCCSACKSPFVKHRRKQHCRHCGKIYCEQCVTKTVAAGPNKRAAHVCDVCHTILVRDTPPYFSQSVPNMTDDDSGNQHAAATSRNGPS